jgi:hypothetical protein
MEGEPLLFGVEGVAAFLKEFVLQAETVFVGLDGTNGFRNRQNPTLHVRFAELLAGDRPVT